MKLTIALSKSPAIVAAACGAMALVLAGCYLTPTVTDREVLSAIEQRQNRALGIARAAKIEPADERDARPSKIAYESTPQPSNSKPPADFAANTTTTSAPTSRPMEDMMSAGAAASQPAQFRDKPLTLTFALAYAQQYRREFLNAREDLYLAALALTLERHLWTPQFAAEARTVYGNFGEDQNFDQAMRFVSDLSVAQRLPYGGSFTAGLISTLIRDVRKSITATEQSVAELGLNLPLLRGAGNVAREELIQLERELTYAVRDFERFRRQQLVDVAGDYFDLLRQKQEVRDAETSLRNAIQDYERAASFERNGVGSPLDTRRAAQRMLSEDNRLSQSREQFRFRADQFKVLIGMPVDEPIGLDDLEDIESIERGAAEGDYPLLSKAAAADDEKRSLEVAIERRLDLLSAEDRIDDARRGVAVAHNALLPNFDWNSTLTFDTDPAHYNAGAFEVSRANWRSELVLAMNDRFRERNEYRQSLINVRQAERQKTDRLEQVRIDVRRAINQIKLQDRLVEIQMKNLEVAESRLEYARIQYEDGDIGNRDLVEAQDELVAAQNALNQAKTSRWSALLEYRLATETLLVDEDGAQEDAAEIR